MTERRTTQLLVLRTKLVCLLVRCKTLYLQGTLGQSKFIIFAWVFRICGILQTVSSGCFYRLKFTSKPFAHQIQRWDLTDRHFIRQIAPSGMSTGLLSPFSLIGFRSSSRQAAILQSSRADAISAHFSFDKTSAIKFYKFEDWRSLSLRF